MSSKKKDTICVLGAGSSGLAAAKNLKEQEFAIELLERECDLGGDWNFELPCSRVYRSTHTITSKKTTEYPDFPMPRDYPDFPHHTQILQYLRDYAAHFDLESMIQYGVAVETVNPIEDGSLWDIALSSGETRRYRAVVIANGHNWSPSLPDYPGSFTGMQMHSAQYKTPEVLLGKRVLVVGARNSGCDIAVEAAQNGCRIFHSTRRGYYYIPKYLFGRPSDRVGEKLLRLGLPLAVRRWLTQTLSNVVVGRPERQGLPKPDHKLYETHPLVNTLLSYYVRHGGIVPKPEIERFEGRQVHFGDGTSEEIDLVLFATGYQIAFFHLSTGAGSTGGKASLVSTRTFFIPNSTISFSRA